MKKTVVKTQPNFGNNQIKKVSEIEMGKMYRRHHAKGTEIVIPVRHCHKEGWIKAKSIFDNGIITEKAISLASIKNQSLADWGIISYLPSNKYNSNNWLEKVNKEDIMAKKVTK